MSVMADWRQRNLIFPFLCSCVALWLGYSRQAQRKYYSLDELIDKDPVPAIAVQMGSAYLAPNARQPGEAHWPAPRFYPQIPESVQATSMLQEQYPTPNQASQT